MGLGVVSVVVPPATNFAVLTSASGSPDGWLRA